MAEYIDREKTARFLAKQFDCPCNFSPLDEKMSEICGDTCQDDCVECWKRVLDTVVPIEFETPFAIKGIPEQQFIDILKKSPIQVIKDDEDVTPVKRGKWIKENEFQNKADYACSICDTDYTFSDIEMNNWCNYCPNCGAKMDLED